MYSVPADRCSPWKSLKSNSLIVSPLAATATGRGHQTNGRAGRGRADPRNVPAMTSTIVASELRKRYGETRAVDGVSFEVERGEFFGILGPNGAGKTTTLEIVEGLRKADSGEVTVLGKDRKSTRLNSSHMSISYAVFCLKKKKQKKHNNS